MAIPWHILGRARSSLRELLRTVRERRKESFLPQTDVPSVPSVQSIWVGADWNEKETWDLVGIKFEGHENMHRVLNPHDSPEGFHPLQKQHKIRYHDFNEMYDDAQGFGRKPTDEGRVK